jgi:hypothetical protein
MSIIFGIIKVILDIFITLYIVADLFLAVRNNKYQRLWNIEKVELIRNNAVASYPEMCEKYVNFCRKNECQVRF